MLYRGKLAWPIQLYMMYIICAPLQERESYQLSRLRCLGKCVHEGGGGGGTQNVFYREKASLSYTFY